MGYYMGGDRDDFGNYTPTVVKPKFKTKTQFEIKKGIELPAEFDPDFYTQKQSEFGKFSPDYWEWKKFSDFSSAVYAFYRQAVMQFYEKFPPKSPLSKLEETAIGIKKEDLHELANNVKAAENNLISQFDKSSRSLSAKIKKYAQLMRLREYAAQAWVMFEAINKKLYVADAVKFKNRYNNFNLNSDVDLIKTFRGAKILKMLTRKLNAKNLLTKKMGLSSQIYFQLDGEAILNDLLGKVDGFKTTDYDDLLPQQTIAYLKQKYPKLTDIYSNFEFILFLIKKLNEKTIDYNEGNIFVDFDECINGEEIDIYLAASEFLDEINDVLQDELDKRFVEDLLYFRENLKDALIFSKQVYINCGYNV